MDDPSTPGSEGFGLMYYGARWYDASLGRFAQPDSIVPTSTQGTQAWDRYAYVNNNPVRYNDPTGHSITQCSPGDSCGGHPDGSKASKTGGVAGNSGSNNGNSGTGELQGPPVRSPNCMQPDPLCITQPPTTTTLHPLSGNVVSEEIIYDCSFYPCKPIGVIRVVYEKNGAVHFDPLALVLGLLPIPPDLLDVFGWGISWANAVETRLVNDFQALGFVEDGASTLGTFAKVFSRVANVITLGSAINGSISITSNLSIHVVYTTPAPFSSTFTDPFYTPR